MMTYIFDLEGTITESKWREHLLPDYDAFHAEFPKDKVNKFIYTIIENLYYISVGKEKIIILTGMMEKHRNMAVQYLFDNVIPYNELIMRPNDNLLPSPQFKIQTIKERFKDLSDVVCFDDRLDNCQEFIKNGITTLKVN